jgi:hypothetical protein
MGRSTTGCCARESSGEPPAPAFTGYRCFAPMCRGGESCAHLAHALDGDFAADGEQPESFKLTAARARDSGIPLRDDGHAAGAGNAAHGDGRPSPPFLHFENRGHMYAVSEPRPCGTTV